MARHSSRLLALAALVSVVGTSACARAPETAMEGSVGPHRFLFPTNLYQNQIGPSADGAVVLRVLWPSFDAAPPGSHPLTSVEDGYREVSIELHHLDRMQGAEYLHRRVAGEGLGATQGLAQRVAMPTWRGLTPYAVDRTVRKTVVNERGARPVTAPPDWYVARDGDARLRTFISCDPGEWVPDGLLVESGKLVRASGDRVAMCQHSFVDGVRAIAVDVTYARVMVRDWERVEEVVRRMIGQYEVKP